MVCDDMHYWRLTPDARLRGRVLCYFVVRYAAGRFEPHRQANELLIPDGHSEIVFSFAGAYERWAVGDTAQRAVMQPSYIIGGRSHSVLTRNLDNLSLIGVKLDSRAMRTLIGTPLAEFRDTTLTLADLKHRALLDLEDELADLSAVSDIAARLDRFFLTRLDIAPGIDSDVDWLLRHIRAHRGALSIMRWSRHHRLDARSLERRFCAWTGMTPKRYARVIRFKHSYQQWLNPRRDTCDAHLDGYYDQSHFDREFRYFTGVTPRARTTGKMLGATSVTDHLLEGEFLGG